MSNIKSRSHFELVEEPGATNFNLPRDELPSQLETAKVPLELWQETHAGLRDLLNRQQELIAETVARTLELELELANDMMDSMEATQNRLEKVPGIVLCLCCCCIFCCFLPCRMLCKMKRSVNKNHPEILRFAKEMEDRFRALDKEGAAFVDMLNSAYGPLGIAVGRATRQQKQKDGKTIEVTVGLRFTSDTGFERPAECSDESVQEALTT